MKTIKSNAEQSSILNWLVALATAPKLEATEVTFNQFLPVLANCTQAGLWVQRVEVKEKGYRLTFNRMTQQQKELL